MTLVEALRRRLHAERESLPHCVYRAYDDSGSLLYVGVTYDFAARQRQHLNKSGWAQDAVRWSTRWFGCRADALDSETAAIYGEAPMHNVRYDDRAARSASTKERRKQADLDAARSDLRAIMSGLRGNAS